MKRRVPLDEQFDAVDVLLARRHLKHWGQSVDRGLGCEHAHHEVVELLAALRALTRPLTDSEAEALRLAAAAGV